MLRAGDAPDGACTTKTPVPALRKLSEHRSSGAIISGVAQGLQAAL